MGVDKAHVMVITPHRHSGWLAVDVQDYFLSCKICILAQSSLKHHIIDLIQSQGI